MLGASTLGGCAGLGVRSTPTPTPTPRPDRDGDGVPDAADDYPTDDRRATRSFRTEGTPTLRPGEFSAVALTNSPRASGDVLHYEVAVAGDTAVDCLVFRRDAYDAYEAGARDVPVVAEYSRTAVTDADVTARLDRGEYLFAVDHTTLLTDSGTGSVEVHVVVETAEPGPSERR